MLYVVVMHVTSQAISSGLLTADRDLNKEVNFLWYDPSLPNEFSMNLLAGRCFFHINGHAHSAGSVLRQEYLEQCRG